MQLSLNMQQLQPAELYGVTKNDLQEIYDNALREFKTRVFFLDASYLYTFHLDDFEYVRKFNILGRYDVRGIGDGDIDEPSLADTDLEHRIDLINVNETPEGGSLSRHGTTIYSVGN